MGLHVRGGLQRLCVLFSIGAEMLLSLLNASGTGRPESERAKGRTSIAGCARSGCVVPSSNVFVAQLQGDDSNAVDVNRRRKERES